MPEKINLSPALRVLLASVYPTVDWRKVTLYKGLPWFIPAQSASAIVLPNAYSWQHTDIYFKNWNPTTCRQLSILIHEGFHVLQLQSLQKGRGLGMARGFLMLYFAHYFANFWHFWRIGGLEVARSQAYFQHPMEIPAYAQDEMFHVACSHFGLARLAAENRLNETEVHRFIQQNTQLIQIQANQNPPLSYLWWLLSIPIVLSLIFVRPIGDLFVIPLWAMVEKFKKGN